jgi:amino-acid N-acetyltransferase
MLEIRKASLTDIGALLGLINAYAVKGIMLPRTEFEMAENIRDFLVAFDAERLLGCGALHFYTATSGEVRSLAVDPSVKTQGIGRALVEALEEEARGQELHSIFAFTYVPGFFGKLGFEEVDRGELPLKAWKDCLRCPKFQACDEIAVLKRLKADATVPVVRLTQISDFPQFPVTIKPLNVGQEPTQLTIYPNLMLG